MADFLLGLAHTPKRSFHFTSAYQISYIYMKFKCFETARGCYQAIFSHQLTRPIKYQFFTSSAKFGATLENKQIQLVLCPFNT